MDLYLSKQWPLFSNLKQDYQENKSNSEMLNGEGNIKNNYVAKSAKRYNFSIQEAIIESLSTIPFQLAAWISLANVIENHKTLFKSAFNVEITEQMFQLKDGEFTNFASSAVFFSLLFGILALTVAQVKQYMTRHTNDMALSGKIVYFLACLFNSWLSLCHKPHSI